MDKNLEKMVEESRILIDLANPPFKKVFKIPVGGELYKKKWWQFWKPKHSKELDKQVVELLKSYKENIEWDENTGEANLDINLPFDKEIWLPKTDK